MSQCLHLKTTDLLHVFQLVFHLFLTHFCILFILEHISTFMCISFNCVYLAQHILDFFHLILIFFLFPPYFYIACVVTRVLKRPQNASKTCRHLLWPQLSPLSPPCPLTPSPGTPRCGHTSVLLTRRCTFWLNCVWFGSWKWKWGLLGFHLATVCHLLIH